MYVAVSNAHRFVVWSNFEIANMEFWRGEVYTKYFEYLDSKGGFYYEVRNATAVMFLSTPSLSTLTGIKTLL